MAKIHMYPMTYVHFERGEQVVTLVYATNTNRILKIMGTLKGKWIHTDMNLAETRLVSSGWKETGRGKVEL